MVLKGALFWTVLFAVVFVTWKIFDLPEGEAMVALVAKWLAAYGLGLVFFGSMVEALLFVGLYFPGSILISLAVGLAESPLAASATILWNSVWGMVVYHLGEHALLMIDYRVVLLVLGIRILFEGYLRSRRRNTTSTTL